MCSGRDDWVILNRRSFLTVRSNSETIINAPVQAIDDGIKMDCLAADFRGHMSWC